MPLIANWSGRVPAGKVNTDLISSTDFLPTFAEAVGTRVPQPIDGRSFFAQLRGERGQPREWLYSRYVRDGGPKPQWEYTMTAAHKLYRDGTFFDLTADPFEEKPLRVAGLRGPAAASAQALQAALDRFSDARPTHLLVPLGGVAEGGKKQGGKEKTPKKNR